MHQAVDVPERALETALEVFLSWLNSDNAAAVRRLAGDQGEALRDSVVEALASNAREAVIFA
jgi:hypothetical protein